MNKLRLGILLILFFISLTGCQDKISTTEVNNESTEVSIEDNNQNIPEIVFMYDANYNDEEIGTYIFDYQGNIYFSVEEEIVFCNYLDMIDKYQSGDLHKKSEIYGKVGVEVLLEKYNLFRKIVLEEEYNIVPKEWCLDSLVLEEQWSGLYYNSMGDIEVITIFQQGAQEYDVSDQRMYEIIEWVTDAIGAQSIYIDNYGHY